CSAWPRRRSPNCIRRWTRYATSWPVIARSSKRFGSVTASSPIKPCASISLISRLALPNRLIIKSALLKRAERMVIEAARGLFEEERLLLQREMYRRLSNLRGSRLSETLKETDALAKGVYFSALLK